MFTQMNTQLRFYTMMYAMFIALTVPIKILYTYTVYIVKGIYLYIVHFGYNTYFTVIRLYIPIRAVLRAGRSDTNEVISMVILVIIGLALAPTVQSTVTDANLNGTMGTIADIVPILYIVAILALTASYVYVKAR